MTGSKSSKTSRRSESAIRPVICCFLLSALVTGCAAAHFYRSGMTLWFGDAEAHLNIARRLIDSRDPGWYQIGTTWLPLPHLLMIPLVRDIGCWKTGLAGAITAAACMAIAAAFLFAAVLRLFSSLIAASVAAAAVLLNPNALYLGSVPMTEPVFLACLFGVLYFTVRFRETQGWGAVVGTGMAAFAGALTRYEGWFLLPFTALAILFAGRPHTRRRRALCVSVFCVIAGAGPLLWLAHNFWYYGDPLYFYRGPYSAFAVQKNLPYPGEGDWLAAARYYFEAARLIAGWPAIIVGGAGLSLAVLRRAFWPVLLLLLPPCFYVWSIHSAATPIYVPTLPPNTWYNTRYAIAVLPLIGLGAAALARVHRWAAVAALAAIFAPLAVHPSATPIVRQEADVNSRARRAWTGAAARYLAAAMDPHDTVLATFGDMTGVFRSMGLPLRDTLTSNNDLEWAEATTRPELFLHADWAVATGGDPVETLVDRARSAGPRYELERRIIVRGAPAIEIYRRTNESPVR